MSQISDSPGFRGNALWPARFCCNVSVLPPSCRLIAFASVPSPEQQLRPTGPAAAGAGGVPWRLARGEKGVRNSYTSGAPSTFLRASGKKAFLKLCLLPPPVGPAWRPAATLGPAAGWSVPIRVSGRRTWHGPRVPHAAAAPAWPDPDDPHRAPGARLPREIPAGPAGLPDLLRHDPWPCRPPAWRAGVRTWRSTRTSAPIPSTASSAPSSAW